MSSIIEDSTDIVNSSTASKRDFGAKDATFVEETSTITTPGNTPRTGTRARSDASISKRPKASAITLMAKQSGKGKGKKTTKDKPELVTPAEFARRLRLQGQVTVPVPSAEIETETDPGGQKARHQQVCARLPVKEAPSQYLKDYVIFYAGGDLTYASARTRGCMNYVRLRVASCFSFAFFFRN